MVKSLVPIGQKTAVRFVFLDVISTSKEYQPICYVEEELAELEWAPRPVLMTDDMANFIGMSCRCAYCKKPISSSLARCTCGKQPPDRIYVEFNKEHHSLTFNGIFDALFRKVKATRKQANRKEKLINAGHFTKSQIAQLLGVQDGLCFYCACSLINEQGKTICHVDHHVSLLDGGKNEISNLVLACPTCNLRKGAEDVSIFIRRRNKEIAFDRKEKAIAIRKKVKAYKKKIEVKS